MNDTTSTPEEPDGRAGVTTGKPAGSDGPAEAAAATAKEAAPGAGGSVDAGAGIASAARSPAEPAASPGRKTQPATPGKPIKTSTAAGKDASSGNGRASVPASSNDPQPRGPADAPTARLRVPEGGNGSPADRTAAASSVPSSVPASPAAVASGPAAAPPPSSPSSPPPTPVPPPPGGPAPGAIPAPGPAAASPPPWSRVPGQAAPAPEPAGGLLTDGPTAYLLPDAAPAAPDTADQPPQQQSRSWGPIRSGRPRPPRQAALQLKRLDPWSMLKLGLVLAVVIFFIWLVAVGVLYGVLDGMGVWDRLNGTYADLVSGEAPTGSPLISAGRVFGLAAVVGAINSLLFAVAVTIGAFVYNVSADLVGGIEVTLSERD